MQSVLRDPGPMQRFSSVVADSSTPAVIVQRLADGESLKQIAVAWGIPYLRFLSWIAANGDLTEQCTKVRELAGIELRMEGLEIADGEPPQQAVGPDGEPLVDDKGKPVLVERDVARDKLRSDYREKLSRDLHRQLFGKFTAHKHEVTFDLGERLRRAKERLVEPEHEPVVLEAAGDDGLI